MARAQSLLIALLIVLALGLVAVAEASAGHFTITGATISNYKFAGLGNDPDLTLVRGQTYTFNINALGHPFWIKTVQGNGTSDAYNDGVSGNGTAVGTLTFTVPHSAPDTLFYNCQIHLAMTGIINIVDAAAPVPGISASGLVVLAILIIALGILAHRVWRPSPAAAQ